MDYFLGLMIPFIGTTLGAACVFLMKDKINDKLEKALLGFASGVMVAASVWSLLIPSMEMSADKGNLRFMPALIGFFVGAAFLFLLDKITPHLHLKESTPEGPKTSFKKTTMMVLAVTIHNIPEGMAVGVVFAALMAGSSTMTFASALALSIGIAIQNFPEGAIVSMPLKGEGASRKKAFLLGTLSGAVEPAAGALTLFASNAISGALPYFLSFAAGAMIYVVVEELLPEASNREGSTGEEIRTDISTWGFAIGFALMMVLDVALG